MKTARKSSATDNQRDDGHKQKLQDLLMLEREIRYQKSPVDLAFWVVNELHDFMGYSQSLVFRLDKRMMPRIMAVSGLTAIDRDAPFVRWIENRVHGEVKNFQQRSGEFQVREIDLGPDNQKRESETVYAFRQAILVPLADRDGEVFGLWLLARPNRWQDGEKTIAMRLAETISHAFATQHRAKRLRSRTVPNWIRFALPLLALLALFIPVPMTTLAPAEIIANEPEVVAAPLDGVISNIVPQANVAVKAGDVLFEFENTELKAAAELAQRKELVAVARLQTARQAAFNDPGVYRQLAIAKAEADLSQAERKFSQQRLARTIVRASRAGLLVYSGKRDWIGKPVKTGERVMEIADTQQVAVRVDLPVADAITLRSGARVRIFLDANPLKAFNGKVRHASYAAREVAGVGLVYKIVVDLDKSQNEIPRIGLRGTSQIFGEKVFLGFYLFRKPISSVRQYFGI